MATAQQLLAQAQADQRAINALRHRLSHATTYTERHNLQRRIRKLQDAITALYAQYLKKLGHTAATVVGTTKKPRA